MKHVIFFFSLYFCLLFGFLLSLVYFSILEGKEGETVNGNRMRDSVNYRVDIIV